LILRPGSSGAPVTELQQRLAALGFDIPADERGVFGNRTESAVRGFQAIRGIRVDGRCGPETEAALVDSGFRLGDRLLCIRTPMLRGDDVGELQRRLNALGFDAGKEDAIFGPDTERALTEFQRNAALTVDGICGRETIATLDRLGSRADGAVANARERDALRDPRALAGHRVYVSAAPGLEALAGGLVGRLRAAGAEAVLDLAPADESAIAGAANEYRADLFLGVRTRSSGDGEPHPGVACRCCYYASAAGTFRSEAGYEIATAIADGLAGALGGDGAACGRAYTVLRETRMTAVVCEPVVEGDLAGMRQLEAGAHRAAEAAVAAIRRVLEQPHA
jgi:N-acetylmuramoyl-L-alanine amidase